MHRIYDIQNENQPLSTKNETKSSSPNRTTADLNDSIPHNDIVVNSENITPSQRRDIEYNYLQNASPEELEAVEAEVDRRMAEKDEEVVSLNNQIAELN